MSGYAQEWLITHQDAMIKVHNWWSAPETWKKVQDIEAGSSHASWMENFPWTETIDADYNTTTSKEPIDMNMLRQLSHKEARKVIGDGNFGGREQRDVETMKEIWNTAVNETRFVLENDWADKFLQSA